MTVSCRRMSYRFYYYCRGEVAIRYRLAIVVLFYIILLGARLFLLIFSPYDGMLVDSKISKIWYLAINFATSFWMIFFLKYKSVTNICLSNYFSAMEKYYGRNLFITHLPRKMKWDSYFLSVFCSAEIIVPLSIRREWLYV